MVCDNSCMTLGVTSSCDLIPPKILLILLVLGFGTFKRFVLLLSTHQSGTTCFSCGVLTETSQLSACLQHHQPWHDES